jgi:hypothetical protein
MEGMSERQYAAYVGLSRGAKSEEENATRLLGCRRVTGLREKLIPPNASSVQYRNR